MYTPTMWVTLDKLPNTCYIFRFCSDEVIYMPFKDIVFFFVAAKVAIKVRLFWLIIIFTILDNYIQVFSGAFLTCYRVSVLFI